MRKLSILLVVLCFFFCNKNPVDTGPIKPLITGYPQSVTVEVCHTATFAVVATGTKPFTYKWQKNGADISGATDSSYTTQAAFKGDSGSTFRCIVSNSVGKDTSAGAFLIVIDTFLIDIDGNVYHIVKIGSQFWTVENLRTTKYNDGTVIPHVTDYSTWCGLRSPAYCFYNNSTDTAYQAKWGALYNWYTVAPTNPKQIAPSGWRIPTLPDWKVIMNYLIANGYNYDGTTTGNKIAKSMSAKTGWQVSASTGAIGNDLNLNNRTGFSALPGGFRIIVSGNFIQAGSNGHWWGASEMGESIAFFPTLNYNCDRLIMDEYEKNCGASVRLVRDVEEW